MQIAYARIFICSCSNKLEQGFFESFSESNVIDGCVNNKHGIKQVLYLHGIREFFSNKAMNCQKVVFLLRKIH